METTTRQIPSYHFDALKRLESGYWWYEGRLYWAKSFIKRWLSSPDFIEPINYADLGCGTGGFARAIQNQFRINQTLLVDNDPEALDKIPPNQKAHLMKLDLESEFDLKPQPNLVTCMDVIEHLHQDQKFLDNIFHNLKPGGLLVLSTAAHDFLFSNWDKKLGHYRRYEKRTLIEKLEKAGFKIAHISYGWSFLFPLAPYRFLFSKRQERLDYPKVPRWLNTILIKLSQWEIKLSDWINYPFGISIFISASKE